MTRESIHIKISISYHSYVYISYIITYSSLIVFYLSLRRYLSFIPLRSNGDQRQISLSNINAFSVIEVMRIKDMIT